MTRPWCQVLVLMLAMSWAVPPAMAAPTDDELAEARAHFGRGEKLYALGRFEDALVAYEDAFEAVPLPGFLFNIGQCHRNLGNLELAIFSFRKYLRLDPDATNRRAVLRLIDELETEHAAAKARADAKVKADATPAPRPPPRRVELVPSADEARASDEARPFYRSWWFIGGSAALAAVAVTAVVLAHNDGEPASDLGNLDFP